MTPEYAGQRKHFIAHLPSREQRQPLDTGQFARYLHERLGMVTSADALARSYEKSREGNHHEALHILLKQFNAIPEGMTSQAFWDRGNSLITSDMIGAQAQFQFALSKHKLTQEMVYRRLMDGKSVPSDVREASENVQKHAWYTVLWHNQWINKVIQQEAWLEGWPPEYKEAFFSAALTAAWEKACAWDGRYAFTTIIHPDQFIPVVWDHMVQFFGLEKADADYILPYRHARFRTYELAANHRSSPDEERFLQRKETAFFLVSLWKDRENKAITYDKSKELDAILEYIRWYRGGRFIFPRERTYLHFANVSPSAEHRLYTTIRKRVGRISHVVEKFEPSSIHELHQWSARDEHGEWGTVEGAIDDIADPGANTDALVDQHSLQETLQIMLESLSPREQRILKLRMGFFDGVEHTLEDIARKEGFTQERIRQIESNALAKLRHYTFRYWLRPWMYSD